ncbi:uncharacterized protein LOC116167396 [Photinus pyralis]|nr:uncharacterized protein LOC116167396 [Photinus pyralis]
MNSNVDFLLRAFENGMFSNDGIVKAYHQVLDLIVSGVRLSTEDVARYNDLRAAAQAIYQRDNNETPSTASASVDNEASARHPQPVTENIGSGIAVRRPLDSEDYKYLEIVSEGSRLIKKYNTMSTNLLFKFKSEHKLEAPIVWLESALKEIIEKITRNVNPSDRIGMTLISEETPDKPVGFSFRRADQLNATVMMGTLEKILASNVSFFTHDTLRLRVDRVSLPVGNGGPSRLKMTGTTFNEFCRRKRGIIQINNADNLCLARALVVSIAIVDNDPRVRSFKNGHPIVELRALELCTDAVVDLSNGGTLEHIRQFQHHLLDYTIVVYNHRQGKTVYFEGPRDPARKVLNLLFENNHYNVIESLTAAFSAK